MKSKWKDRCQEVRDAKGSWIPAGRNCRQESRWTVCSCGWQTARPFIQDFGIHVHMPLLSNKVSVNRQKFILLGLTLLCFNCSFFIKFIFEWKCEPHIIYFRSMERSFLYSWKQTPCQTWIFKSLREKKNTFPLIVWISQIFFLIIQSILQWKKA